MTENKHPIMIGKDKPKSEKKQKKNQTPDFSSDSDENKRSDSVESRDIISSGEQTNIFHEKKPVVKTFIFPVLSFSFIISVIFFNLLFFAGIFAGISYYSIENRLAKMNEVYYQRGKEINLIISSLARNSLRKENYRDLNILFAKLVNKSDAIKRENSVQDVAFISDKGEVLAHSDMSKITISEKNPSKRISEFYNQDFFHEPLLFESGNVLVKDYHFFKEGIRDRYSHFIEFLLAEKFSYSTDFASSIEYRGKNAATLHIILNKMYIYNFIKNWAMDSLWLLGAVEGSSLLFSFIVLFIFYLRGKSIKKVCTSYLLVKEQKISDFPNFEKSLSRIVEKIDNLPNIEKEKKSNDQKRKPESAPVLDAILIEEE